MKRYVILFLLCLFPQLMMGSDVVNSLKVFEVVKLDNGLTLHLAQDDFVPIVVMQAKIKQGRNHEAPGQEGFLNLFYDTLLNTPTRTVDEIAYDIEKMGGSLTTGIGLEVSNVDAFALSRDIDKLITLFADVLQNPHFPNKEIMVSKERLTQSLKEKYSDNGELLSLHSFQALTGDSHRNGRKDSPEAIQNVTQEQLKTFHENWFQPKAIEIFVYGDFDKETLLSLFNKALGQWENTHIVSPDYVIPIFNPPGKTVYVNKEGLTQSFVKYLSKSIPRNHPDYPALMLLTDILGSGRFSSRLMKAIRVEGGRSYGASARLNLRKTYGFLSIQTFTRHEELAGTLSAIDRELNKLQNSPVLAEELTLAKQYYFGSFPLSLETPGDQLQYYTYYSHHHISREGLKAQFEAIEAVTISDISRVSKTYFRPELFHRIILTTEKTELEPL